MKVKFWRKCLALSFFVAVIIGNIEPVWAAERTQADAPSINLVEENGVFTGEIEFQNNDESNCTIWYGFATKEQIDRGVQCDHGIGCESTYTTTIEALVKELSVQSGEYYIVAYAENGDGEPSEVVVIEDYPIMISKTVLLDDLIYQIGSVSGNYYFGEKSIEEYDYAKAQTTEPYESGTASSEGALNIKDDMFYINAGNFDTEEWYVEKVEFGKLAVEDQRCVVEVEVYSAFEEGGIHEEARTVKPTLTLDMDADGNVNGICVQNNDDDDCWIYYGFATKEEVETGKVSYFTLDFVEPSERERRTFADVISSTISESGEYQFVVYAQTDNEEPSEVVKLENYPFIITISDKKEPLKIQLGNLSGNIYFPEKSIDEYDYAIADMQVTYIGGDIAADHFANTKNGMFCIGIENYKEWNIKKAKFYKCNATETNYTMEMEIYTSIEEGEFYQESRTQAPTITTEISGEEIEIYMQNNDEQYSYIYYGLATIEEIEAGEWDYYSIIGVESDETSWVNYLSNLIQSKTSTSGTYYIVAYAANGNEARSELTILEDYPITATVTAKEDSLAYQIGNLTGRGYFAEKSTAEYDYAEAELMVSDEGDDSWLSEMTLGTDGEMISFDADYLNNNYKDWNIEKITFYKINAAEFGCTVEKEVYTSVAEGGIYEEARTEAPTITLETDEEGIEIYVQNNDEEYSCIYYGLATGEQIEAGEWDWYSGTWLEESETSGGSSLNYLIQSKASKSGIYYIMAYAENGSEAKSELTVLEDYPIAVAVTSKNKTLEYQVGALTGYGYFTEKSADEYEYARAELQVSDESGDSWTSNNTLSSKNGMFYLNQKSLNNAYKEWSVQNVEFCKINASEDGCMVKKEIYTSVAEGDAYDEGTSGVIDEAYGQITWNIDSDGNLTVTGTGDLAEEKNEAFSDRLDRIPWIEYTDFISSAKINVKGMEDASYLFLFCEQMETIDLTEFDTSNVVDMRGLFECCLSLGKIDLSSFDTSNVVNMEGMFEWCSPLETPDFSGFDTSKVTNMEYMFGDFNFNNHFEKLDLSSFDTSNVVSMHGMFGNCQLKLLDLSSFDTQNVTNMDYMFGECMELDSLDLSNFDMRSVMQANDMLRGCDNLEQIEAPLNCSVEVELPTTSEDDKWYLSDGTIITHLPQGLTKSVTIMKNQIPEVTPPEEEPKPPVTETFTDVKPGEWYVEEIQYVFNKGMMSGVDGETFMPDEPVNRAMVVQTLYKNEGRPEVTDFTKYDVLKDINRDQWWANGVAWGMNHGIVKGYSDTMTFKPENSVTREDLATFLYRYARDVRKVDVTLSRSVDAILGDAPVNSWAKDAFAWAIDKGLIKGITKTDSAGNTYYDLSPETGATRAQMATILMRFCEKYNI